MSVTGSSRKWNNRAAAPERVLAGVGVRLLGVRASLLLEQRRGASNVAMGGPGVRGAARNLAFTHVAGGGTAVPSRQLKLVRGPLEQRRSGFEILVQGHSGADSTAGVRA